MKQPDLRSAIQPNLLSLLERLDHYLERDEDAHVQGVIEAALAGGADGLHRARLEQSRLDMVRQAQLETEYLRQSILASSEWLDQGVQTVSLLIDMPAPDANIPVL